MNQDRIRDIVLEVMTKSNQSRVESERLDVSPDAAIFGKPSRLDSLGLVALLIDIEEAFADEGHPIVLSDERAMSQKRSPFRDVPSLVTYISGLVTGQ